MACSLFDAKHYLNECWPIASWTLKNKLQWHFNRNSNIFTEDNIFWYIVCKMLTTMSLPRCVNQSQATTNHTKAVTTCILGMNCTCFSDNIHSHCIDMSVMADQINNNCTACAMTCSSYQQRNHQSPTLLALCKNTPMTDKFPSHRASNARIVFI